VQHLDWVVFGDDWGTHPSTEQHLVLNFPSEDRVIWLDSIGMRNPKLNIADMRRIYAKGKALLCTQKTEEALYADSLAGFKRIKPKVLPWHKNSIAARFNRYSLAKTIRHEMEVLGMERPILLSSTPVVVKYLASIPHTHVFYLRQDEYETYPGCDPELVRETEPVMFELAEKIFVTANSLYPGGELNSKSYYLPHGVQLSHFRQVPIQPGGKKVLGFFGTIDERMNFQLVKEVAEAAEGWELEFIGDVLYMPSWLATIPNIRFRPMVSFRELPVCLSDWAMGWTPYVINEMTKGIHPLKVREYLAAGFAAHCTPLPEASLLNDKVMISENSQEIVSWLNTTFMNDSARARQLRRDSVSQDDWSVRASNFRDEVQAVFNENS